MAVREGFEGLAGAGDDYEDMILAPQLRAELESKAWKDYCKKSCDPRPLFVALPAY